VPLDKEEEGTHADAVEKIPLSDSEEELRSKHDNKLKKKNITMNCKRNSVTNDTI